jgi:Zn-dependent protease with chaperone function
MTESARAPITLLRREQSHRRVILLAIASLLVLGMSPLFGHHLPLGIDQALAGHDHLWALCLIALHELLSPVHTFFHALFLAGVSYAAWDRVRAWRSVRIALGPIAARGLTAGEPIGKAAGAAGVDIRRVRVVHGLPVPAFTAGWLMPRVYVAAELTDRLSNDELAAVLAHEWAHVARRDPLRLSALRFLACALFWIPALRRLAADVSDEGEVRADDVAAARHGLALATALVRLASWDTRRSRAIGVGFTGGDLLERRVLRLTGEDVPPKTRVNRRSLLGAAFALVLAWSSGLAVAHPLPDGHDAHCEDHASALVFHLFCRSGLHGVHDDCPHRHQPDRGAIEL